MVKRKISRKGKTADQHSQALIDWYLPQFEAEIERMLDQGEKIVLTHVFSRITGLPKINSHTYWQRPILELIRAAKLKQLTQYAPRGKFKNADRVKVWKPLLAEYLQQHYHDDEPLTINNVIQGMRKQYSGFPLNIAANEWSKPLADQIKAVILQQRAERNITVSGRKLHPSTTEVVLPEATWRHGSDTYRARPLGPDDIIGRCPYTGEPTTYAIEVRRRSSWVAKKKVSTEGLRQHQKAVNAKALTAAR